MENHMRIGHGYDVHKLVEGRKLFLGGVEIEHPLGLLGHSDADVCLHAIMDAILELLRWVISAGIFQTRVLNSRISTARYWFGGFIK